MSEENTTSSSHPSERSVQYLIDLYDSIGVPHFQRGLVWSEENTSLLLESLYLKTPCGTIILWEPKNPSDEGIPLSDPRKLKYLVIDGQQRIRSLRDVFNPDGDTSSPEISEDEGSASDDTEPSARHVWCLNLARVRELTELVDDGMSRYPMFRLMADPTSELTHIRHNLVPLRIFLQNPDADISKLIRPAKNKKIEDVQSKIREISLGDSIGKLRERTVFFLKILPKENNLAEVVALYNRINSAGKRVEAEEKAFATLVLLHPSTSDWLKCLFKDVHPSAPAGDLERDGFLKRRKERNFGFKLFIRTFIQVCAYRFQSSLGSNSFSFDVVNSLPFQRRLKKEPAETKRLFDRTSQVVRFVRALLGDGLKCDDLQTLPDTTSLLPLFQVLIRFPDLMVPDYMCVLQCLTLRLLLSQSQSQERILKLVKLVNVAETANECLKKLDGEISGPDELRKTLRERLKEANTLQDRYVLMLYWLLRKGRACDFSYENLTEENRVHLQPGKEVELEEGVEPEKQHIVPYSLLKKLYNIEKRGRVSRNPVNNIGNITFISQKLNSFETGLGSKAIDLGQGSDPNLESHLLGAKEVRNAYAATNAADATPEKARIAFEEFCKLRRELIMEAFLKWIDELGPGLTIGKRVPPAERFDPSLQDRVRELGYPTVIEDAVLDLARTETLRFVLARRKKVPDKELVRKVKSRSDKKGFIIRFLKDQIEVEQAAGSALYETLAKLRPTSPFQQERRSKWVLPTRGEGSADTTRILIEFAQQQSHGNP